MGDAKAHLLHRGDHRRGRRCAAGRDVDDVLEAALRLGRRVDQHVEHDGRAAEVGHAMRADGREHRRRLHPAQADMGGARRRHGPGEGPAVAMEHGQRPQVDAVGAEEHRQRVAQRIEVGAAMVVDDALGVAGGARGVEQRHRIPFVERTRPVERGIAFGEQRVVGQRADARVAGPEGVVEVDDQQVARIAVLRGPQRSQRVPRQPCEFAVDQQHPRLAVGETEREAARVQAVVERVEHRAQRGYRVMRLEHRRHVGRQHRDRVAAAHAARRQRRGEPAAAR